jgi:hypothetical protein
MENPIDRRTRWRNGGQEQEMHGVALGACMLRGPRTIVELM